MEILYSIFIGIIFGMNVGMIVGIGLLCRRDSFHFKDRDALRVSPPLHLRRLRCCPPRPGQSLCCTSSFADCAKSGFTSTILCCITAATRTSKTVLARSTG